MLDDGRKRIPGKPSEVLLEGLAALLILIGGGAAALVFIGLLFKAVVWAWS